MSTDYIPLGRRSLTAQRILNATIVCLVKNHFSGTSFGALAQELGLSKGVIHYHFPHKEMLLQETIAYIYETAFTDIRPGIDARQDDWAKIEYYIRAGMAFHRDRAEYVLAMHEIIVNFQPVKHRSYAMKRLEQELAEVTELLVAGQVHGTFRDFDPAIMALTIRQALNGTVGKIDAENCNFEHLADELVGIFRHAIVSPLHAMPGEPS